MHLTYNGYSHAEDEVWFNITKKAVFGPRNTREKELQRWDIFGVVQGDNEAALSNAMSQLETAYSTNNGDLLFYGNSASLTRHTLYSADTLNGVRVHQFNWLKGNPGIWGSGVEYTNKRTYHIVVMAEKLWADNNLYFYRSTISGTGTCGPKKIWMPSLTGLPQGQNVQAWTTQKVVQTGMNIGLVDYEAPDGPLFSPGVEHLDRRNITKLSAQEVGINQSLKFPTRWTYYFESPIALL
jgi:hypothetical protein